MQQREEALKDGFSRIDWTFDPMESLNANLNVRKLRAHVVDFKPNLYGEVASDLIGGLPTHRFLVRWNLNQSIAPTADANIPPSIIEVDGKPELTVEDPSTLGNLVSVMTVRDYQGLKHKNMPLARIWQEKVCAAAAALLKAGFHGTGFRDLPGDGRCLYLFEKQNA